MELKACFVGLGVALVAASIFASSGFEWIYANVIATEVDGNEDSQQLLTLDELRAQDAFENQRYLVVGGLLKSFLY